MHIWNIGKKGFEHFSKNKFNADETYKDIFLHLTFENVQACAQAAVKAFESGQFDVVNSYTASLKMLLPSNLPSTLPAHPAR